MSSAIFNFDSQKIFAQSIEVEDIGNCALKCLNRAFDEYYVITQTVMGKTYILKFGPIQSDLGMLQAGFNLSYKKINYKEEVIEKEITLLLVDSKKEINSVEQISIEDALNLIPTSDMFIPEE